MRRLTGGTGEFLPSSIDTATPAPSTVSLGSEEQQETGSLVVLGRHQCLKRWTSSGGNEWQKHPETADSLSLVE